METKEIELYGERKSMIEIDEVTHQFVYLYKEKYYAITKHKGEIITVFEIKKRSE